MIIKRADGSFVIEKNGYPCHIPNEGEWAEEWAQVNAQALANPSEVQIEAAPTLEELKEAKRAEIWAAGDALPDVLDAMYTRREKESFTDQRLGAQALKDGTTDTREAKIVAGIASRRGIELSTQVEKILRNVAIADHVGTQVIGEQQRLDDLIKAANTEEQLNAIQWTMTLGELLAELTSGN